MRRKNNVDDDGDDGEQTSLATGGGAGDDRGGGMSVLKKVYPLGQVPQITTQHRELLPQQRQALGSQVTASVLLPTPERFGT